MGILIRKKHRKNWKETEIEGLELDFLGTTRPKLHPQLHLHHRVPGPKR